MSLPTFVNEPVLELRRSPSRDLLLEGLEQADARLPLRTPILIGRDRREGDDLVSTDPAQPDRVVAVAAKATPQDADEAVAAAQKGFTAWSRVAPERRAQILVAAAAWMRERRAHL